LIGATSLCFKDRCVVARDDDLHLARADDFGVVQAADASCEIVLKE
jgi:hypothetical protein